MVPEKSNHLLLKLTICLAGFLYSFWPARLWAQPQCKLEYYATENGLSHQAITTMLKDEEGFMWFGTWDGINRFDGQRFVPFKSIPGDMSTLENDRIDQIVEGKGNMLWILAYNKKVYRFSKVTATFEPIRFETTGTAANVIVDKILGVHHGYVWLSSARQGLFAIPETYPEKGRILHFSHNQPSAFHLAANDIRFIHASKDAKIWVGTGNGLALLTPASDGSFQNQHKLPKAIALGSPATCFTFDKDHLFFIAGNSTLWRYQTTSRHFDFIQLGNRQVNALQCSANKTTLYATTQQGSLLMIDSRKMAISGEKTIADGKSIHAIFEDSKGNLWLEPDVSGVIRFNIADQSSKLFNQPLNDPTHTIGNRYKVVEDFNGTIWVNQKKGAFGYYNETTQNFDNRIITPSTKNQVLPPVVIGMFYDADGVIWLRILGGDLVKMIIQRNNFRQIFPEKNPTLLVSANSVRGLLYDSQNRVWIGTRSGQLSIFENDRQIPVQSLLKGHTASSLGMVYSMLEDKTHRIWLGTKDNGLFVATPDGSDQSGYSVQHYSVGASAIPQQVYALHQDFKGNIWIGTFENGLYQVNEKAGTLSFEPVTKPRYPAENFKKIRHLATDAFGNLWLGTTDGLVVIPANGEAATCYSKQPGDITSLGNNNIQFIFKDSQQQMWLATSGGGFCKAEWMTDKKALQFTSLTTRNGLPNDYVLSCTEDNAGNLWIATENGLARFSPASGQFAHFDAADGLPKLSFAEASVTRNAAASSLFFGSTDGVISFNPAAVKTRRIVGKIALTSILINNQPFAPQNKQNEAHPLDINYTSSLDLSYNQNIISINYAIPNHRAGNNQAFAYRLTGFDTAWQNDHQQRRATYTNLPPGHYEFEVKSLNPDWYTNLPYRKLSFTIAPPPWKSWWAYLIYLLTAAAIIFFIRRNALAMLQLKQKIAIEQKVAALKMNFFTNISHELRTPLTLITNPIEQISKKENLSAEGKNLADTIGINAQRMLRFINQLLDLRKVENNKASLHLSKTELVGFLQMIMNHFSGEAKSRQISIVLKAEQPVLNAQVDADKLDVIVYNLLGNAMKFTPNGKTITLSLGTVGNGSHLFIRITDEGAGVPESQLSTIFEMFVEGESQHQARQKGSGIGLALAKQFVEIHHGKIWATNRPAGGFEVNVELPLIQTTGSESAIMESALPTIGVAEVADIAWVAPTEITASTNAKAQASQLLLVEDNDELRQFLQSQLTENYKVAVAKNGKEGLEMAATLMPDLIISDVMMPEMDGIQMLDKLKNDLLTSHIPVILLTARAAIEHQIGGLQYGADYYITKPFNQDFLEAAINNLLLQRTRLFHTLLQKRTEQPEQNTAGRLGATRQDEAFLQHLIDLVEEKMADPDFHIESLAENMAMSRTAFYKKFKSLTGKTPVDFVQQKRLEKAVSLMKDGGKNISEIAYSVGFGNPKYFSTCFKEHYGQTPSDFMKSVTS